MSALNQEQTAITSSNGDQKADGQKWIGVMVVNQGISSSGVEQNAALVLGLSAGRLMADRFFGPDVVDGDGNVHKFLTNCPHFVRKAGSAKVRTLRDEFARRSDVILIDYPEAAAPSSYDAYQNGLAAQSGDAVVYRAFFVFGPEDSIVPMTKNLSRLA